MIEKKVRRLTIRIRNRGQGVGRKHEIGVTTIIATRAGAVAPGTAKAGRLPRRRETLAVRNASATGEEARPVAAAEPIERLVAEARERVLLLSRKSGGGVAQESVLGRLVATGEISRRQHEAGARYAGIVREHDALLGRGDGDDDGAAARTRYRSAMARFDRCRAALRDAGREDRMAAAVVDAVTVNNWELPELTPALRIGLNHLARTLEAMGGEAGLAVTWAVPPV